MLISSCTFQQDVCYNFFVAFFLITDSDVVYIKQNLLTGLFKRFITARHAGFSSAVKNLIKKISFKKEELW